MADHTYDEDTEVKTSDAVVPVIPASSLPEALELQLLLAGHVNHPAVETTGGIIDLSL